MTLRTPDRSAEQFVEKFLETLSPSSIPISDFVDWDRIDDHIEEHQREIQQIQALSLESKDTFRSDLTETLIEYHRTEKLIILLFELVSERNGPFVVVEGTWVSRNP